MNVRTLRIWLRPGMRIKRWALLFMLSITLTGLAVAMGLAYLYRNYDFPQQYSSLVRTVTLQFIPHPEREILLLAGGAALLGYSGWRLSHSLIGPLLRREATGRALADILNEHRFGPSQPEFNIVTIGGGTGLSTLLRGLKHSDANITAIVTVADDGGSTGRIRADFNMPAPGDIRNCLVAMADAESTLGKLFDYRFDKASSDLAGHSFGNLFITALTQVSGSFEQAVIESGRVLNIRGRVLPSTLEDVTLCADLMDGTTVRGESTISHKVAPIKQVFLEPRHPGGYEPALAAIMTADLIVLGPGSLYTSVLPNLLVAGISEAIRWSAGTTAYVCNVATQPGETDHFGFADHVRAITAHLGEGELDYALVNSNPAPTGAIKPEWHIEAVTYEGENGIDPHVTVVARDVVNDTNPLRHDPDKLTAALLEIARGSRQPALSPNGTPSLALPADREPVTVGD